MLVKLRRSRRDSCRCPRKTQQEQIGRGWEIFLPRATLRGPGPSIGLSCLRHETWVLAARCALSLAYLSQSSIPGLGEGMVSYPLPSPTRSNSIAPLIDEQETSVVHLSFALLSHRDGPWLSSAFSSCFNDASRRAYACCQCSAEEQEITRSRLPSRIRNTISKPSMGRRADPDLPHLPHHLFASPDLAPSRVLRAPGAK